MDNVTPFPDTPYRLYRAAAYGMRQGHIEWRGQVISASEDGTAMIWCDDGITRSLPWNAFSVHPETLGRPPDGISELLDGPEPAA